MKVVCKFLAANPKLYLYVIPSPFDIFTTGLAGEKLIVNSTGVFVFCTFCRQRSVLTCHKLFCSPARIYHEKEKGQKTVWKKKFLLLHTSLGVRERNKKERKARSCFISVFVIKLSLSLSLSLPKPWSTFSCQLLFRSCFGSN